MKEFSISNNGITGKIPDEIITLKNLEYFILFSNRITGSIPSTINALQKLRWIDVSDNLLGGGIPLEFYELKNLVNVYFSDNLIEGKIEEGYIGQLSNVRQLFLNRNNLSGTLPTQIGLLSQLGKFLLYFFCFLYSFFQRAFPTRS